MSKEKASLSIKCYVDCPNEDCDAYIDLFEIEHLTEEGYLHKKVLGDRFGCEDLDEEIECPECCKKFKVGCVEW